MSMPSLKSKISAAFGKYREIITYVFFGFATTVVNYVTFYLCTQFIFDIEIPWQMQASNVISWMISVLFAYVTNKKFVFRSHASPLKEITKFYLSRLGTLLTEMLLMYILVTVCNFDAMIIKIAVQFVVIVLNYLFGKLFVFKKTR